MSLFRIIFIIALSALTSVSSFALEVKTPLDDRLKIAEYHEKCLNLKKFLIKRKFRVDCHQSFLHFNASSVRKYYSLDAVRENGKVRIAGYNLWHPGSSKTMFKNYDLVASVMNRWDVVSALELLPVISRDLVNNNKMIGLYKTYEEELQKLKVSLKKAKEANDLKQIRELGKKISELSLQKRKMAKLFRAPGYLKILTALRKLDPSWALLLTPRPDAAKENHVQEFTGFFYRGETVRPIANEHCQERDKKAFACFPNLRASFMGRDVSYAFSRRPFLASFQSGNFDFSLLSSHVIFKSPYNAEDMHRILYPSFGLSDYSVIGRGVHKVNYARIAEMKLIVEVLEKLKEQYREKDVIYVGDTNLQKGDLLWRYILPQQTRLSLLITKSTTVSVQRFDRDEVPTLGLASNYDHFIASETASRECLKRNGHFNTSVFPYYDGIIQKYIQKNYLIRKEAGPLTPPTYVFGQGGERRMNKKLSSFTAKLAKILTVKNGRIVKDDSKLLQKIEFLKKRVFLSQLSNISYYRVYKELLSDHLPIVLGCSTNNPDDD